MWLACALSCRCFGHWVTLRSAANSAIWLVAPLHHRKISANFMISLTESPSRFVQAYRVKSSYHTNHPLIYYLKLSNWMWRMECDAWKLSCEHTPPTDVVKWCSWCHRCSSSWRLRWRLVFLSRWNCIRQRRDAGRTVAPQDQSVLLRRPAGTDRTKTTVMRLRDVALDVSGCTAWQTARSLRAKTFFSNWDIV